MPMIQTKSALPSMGALYVTIRFSVIEIKNKSFISDGNSSFVFNVRNSRKSLLNNAIYNAIKREFPNRTVAAYDIHILNYHYTYYLNDYEVITKQNKKKENRYFETYVDVETKKRKTYVKGRYEIKDNFIDTYRGNTDDNY